MIVIVSWLHYRRSTLGSREYPTVEFVLDVFVMMTYIALFLFTQETTAYYMTLTLVWTLYLLARLPGTEMTAKYFGIGVAFIAVFAAIAWTAHAFQGDLAEWLRILAVGSIALLYRPIDARFYPIEDSAD